MDCSTIIVSYDTYALTHEAVRTALDGAPGLSHDVIVVDNESPDKSAERLREAFGEDSRVHVIDSGGNVGFSAANNIGAAHASGRVLFFLNPDTIVHDDAISTLVAYLDAHPDAGAVGPHVLNVDGTNQPSTAPFHSVRSVTRRLLALPSAALPAERPSAVDVIKGCALAVRRDAFDRVGGWDERYFMYSEETDLCLALVRTGYRNVYVPGATITHIGGAASGDRYVEQQVMAAKSATAFLRRHASKPLVGYIRLMSAAAFGARSVIFGVAARVRPDEGYRQRGDAASALWRYYAFDYS